MSATGQHRTSDTKVATPSDTEDIDDILLSGPPLEIPAFPPELWLEIIGHISDTTTLSTVMRINRAFHDMAERELYHTVTLDQDAVLLRFCASVSMSPHHIKPVTRLHLPAIGGQVLQGYNSRAFFSTLNSLRNLEYLTLRLFEGLERSGVIGTKVFQDIVSMRFPLLRGFSTNLSVYILPIGSAFFREHPLLEDLEVGFSPVSHLRTAGLANFHFGSLRSIACGAWFLHDRSAVPPTLTHYHALDLDLEPGELPHIARLLGHQLVSLRISERFAYYQHSGRRRVLMLDEVAGLFPRLRFFQLDMHLVVVPYISRHVIDCTAHRPQSESESSGVEPLRPRREVRFTLAWLCDRRPASTVYMEAAPSLWDDFLRSTALSVLHHWDDYLERVVYRHTDIPWTSVSMREDRIEPVYKEETAMSDELWRLIQ